MGIAKSLENYMKGIYNQHDKQILKKAGYLSLKEYTQQEVVEIIKTRDFKNCIPKICEWCNKKTLIIHEHHYPIEKNKGGKEVVKICPTCHFEYHLLINGNYELNVRGEQDGNI